MPAKHGLVFLIVLGALSATLAQQPASAPVGSRPADSQSAPAGLDKARAIAYVEKLGGSVKLDAKLSDKPVIAVNLHSKKFTDQDLAACRGFDQLRDLDLINTQVTDQALLNMAIKDKTELVTLGLEFGKVTDATLEQLSGLKNLKTLYLGGDTAITDKGMEHLKGMTSLETLVLFGIGNITDEGVKHLGGLTKMQRLNLRGTKVTDEGLKHLEGMEDLRMLFIWDTAVTDAGLAHLKKFKKLETLLIKNSKVTEAGIAELSKALPQLKFER